MADRILSGGAEEAFVDQGELVAQCCSRLQQRLDNIGQARMPGDEITDGSVPAAPQQAGCPQAEAAQQTTNAVSRCRAADG